MSGCISPADLQDLARGLLDESATQRVEEHLHTCEACRKQYDRYRSYSPNCNDNPARTETQSAIPPVQRDSAPTSIAPRYLPKIEGYRITGVLGQGGMGIVYRAVQTKLNRAVALKVLPSIVGSASPSAVQRFRREATAAARLHHTNIVPIYDFGECRDAYYYAMELIAGQPLNELIKTFAQHRISTASPARMAALIHEGTTGTPAEALADDVDRSSASSSSSAIPSSSSGRSRAYYQQVARWMADAADALDYAHGQGIIHRDIKPGNLILSADGRIMLTDFGLAKSSDEESVTITGSLIGTIRYLSPEQAMAKRIHVDHRTDIYSLGATMYELLTLQPVFPGNDDKQILSAIITRDPIPPRRISVHVPAELETICQKTLEKAPDARYATARDLAEDLRRYLNDLPIAAKRPGPIRRSIKFAKRHRAMVISVTAAVLLATTGTFWWRERIRGAAQQKRAMIATVESLLADGDREMGAGHWGAAVEAYQSALGIHPDSVPALANLAIAKKEQYNASVPHGDPELLGEAVELCTRALNLEPDRMRVWNTKGVLLKMQQRYDDAAEAYARATVLNPQDPYAWANLAAINVLRGRIEIAEENLHRAIEFVTPTDPYSCSILRDLGVVQLLQEDTSASETLEQALQCNPKDERSLLVRARIRLTASEQINAEAARDDAAAADRLSGGENAVVKRYLALACLRLGRNEEAIAHARAAIALGDMETYNQFIIAAAEKKLGRNDAAESALAAATAAWPDKLRKPGDYQPSAVKGFLWFEKANELTEQKHEFANVETSRP